MQPAETKRAALPPKARRAELCRCQLTSRTSVGGSAALWTSAAQRNATYPSKHNEKKKKKILAVSSYLILCNV